MPQVSFIITTYNRAAIVPDAIRSALSCEGVEKEVIVVDDGSTDTTSMVMNEFAGRVNYIRQANSGVALARNVGAAAATSEYLFFLDDDDVFLPEGPRRLLSVIERHPELDLITADVRVGNGANGWQSLTEIRFGAVNLDHLPGTTIEPDLRRLDNLPLFRTGLRRTLLAIGGFVIRRQAFERLGGFCPAAGHVEDWEFYQRAAGLLGFAFLAGAPVAEIRVQPNSRSAIPELMKAGYSAAYQLLANNPALPEEARNAAINARRAAAFKAAWTTFTFGNPALAREQFRSYRHQFGWSPRVAAYEALCYLPAGIRNGLLRTWRTFRATGDAS